MPPFKTRKKRLIYLRYLWICCDKKVSNGPEKFDSLLNYRLSHFPETARQTHRAGFVRYTCTTSSTPRLFWLFLLRVAMAAPPWIKLKAKAWWPPSSQSACLRTFSTIRPEKYKLSVAIATRMKNIKRPSWTSTKASVVNESLRVPNIYCMVLVESANGNLGVWQPSYIQKFMFTKPAFLRIW